MGISSGEDFIIDKCLKDTVVIPGENETVEYKRLKKFENVENYALNAIDREILLKINEIIDEVNSMEEK